MYYYFSTELFNMISHWTRNTIVRKLNRNVQLHFQV